MTPVDSLQIQKTASGGCLTSYACFPGGVFSFPVGNANFKTKETAKRRERRKSCFQKKPFLSVATAHNTKSDRSSEPCSSASLNYQKAFDVKLGDFQAVGQIIDQG